MPTRCAALLACIFLFFATTTHARAETNVKSRIISNLDLRDTKRIDFGKFRFLGGLVLRSSDSNFGGLSAIHISEDSVVTAIADTGFWIIGKIKRDKFGRPSQFAETLIAPLLNSDGLPFSNKWLADAEGMAVGNNTVFVSMEQESRILSFPSVRDLHKQSSQVLSGTDFVKNLKSNFALEAIAAVPKSAGLPFDLVAISEFSPNEDGHARAFFRQSEIWNEFAIPLLDRYLITDAAFMPSGDLLILERRFSLATGARARVRKIASGAIASGKVANGEVVLDLDQNQVLDNMEGMSVFKTSDGKQRLALISDNNLFPLQRTLYLEFELLEGF